MTDKTITAFSRLDIERKIDVFLVEDRPFRPRELIMPVAGSATRFEYRGLHVREWYIKSGDVRYDAAVDLL